MKKSLLVLAAVGSLAFCAGTGVGDSGDKLVNSYHNGTHHSEHHKFCDDKKEFGGHKNLYKDGNFSKKYDGVHQEKFAHGDRDLHFLKGIELSQEQLQDVQKLREKMQNDLKNEFSKSDKVNTKKLYFQKNTFNKELFLQENTNKVKILTEIKADYIENVYNILTESQKTILESEVDK